ncbi:MAG: hypothetical protein AAF934_03115, partial [Bacteroidota bacterium]
MTFIKSGVKQSNHRPLLTSGYTPYDMSTLSALALPVIDIAPLVTDTGDKQAVAVALHKACTN